MEDCMDASICCIILEVIMLPNRAAMGMPINITDEAMTIDFHNIDSSFDKSESIFRESFCNDVLPSLSSNPSNLSANISPS